MKINVDENVIHGTIEIGNEKFEYKAYPPTIDISLMFIEAAEEEDTKVGVRALGKYYDECIEFTGFGAKRIKEKVRKALERSGKFVEFVNEVVGEVGKRKEPKG